MTGRLLTARQVSETLGVSVETVLRWAANGKLPSIRMSSRAIRFRDDAIDEWIAAHELGAAVRGGDTHHEGRAHAGGYAALPLRVTPTPPPTAATTEEDST